MNSDDRVCQLVCRETQARYSWREPLWRSPAGAFLDLELDARFDRARIAARRPTLWRYREALPSVADEHVVSFDEGFTPLIEQRILGRRVLLKCDHLFQTGSYKDRGAALMISVARELGIRHVVEDSSGNAGAAVAAYCARAGLACDIYVPAENSPGKLLQIKLYGARLRPVAGTRETVAAAAWQAAQGAYYASHVWNPFFFHGVKTFVFELVEQLGWQAPDAIVVPTGNGTLLYGALLGLRELRAAGLIDRLPRMVAVQAAACAPLVQAWRDGSRAAAPVAPAPTAAEGIAIANPMRAADCLAAVRETDGLFIAVDEGEIWSALRAAASHGLFIEPTSAAALAALNHLDAAPDDRVVVVLTGHGLKASDTIRQFARTAREPRAE